MISRRALFTKPIQSSDSKILPPWSGSIELFTKNCTQCKECVRACPQNIIKIGDNGFPEVTFSQSGCDFCQKCAAACKDKPIDPLSNVPAWSHKATINQKCLNNQNIFCQSCTDECEPQALRFLYTAEKPSGFVAINPDDCTGCGFCNTSCPADAIVMRA